MQAFVHAAGDAFGREIKFVHVVASALGAEEETVATNLLERLAQDFFGKCAAIVRRGVDEVDAAIERDVQGADALRLVEVAIFIADGRRAVADDGKIETGFAQWTGLHAADFTGNRAGGKVEEMSSVQRAGRIGMNLKRKDETAEHAEYANGRSRTNPPPGARGAPCRVPPFFSRGWRSSRFNSVAV